MLACFAPAAFLPGLALALSTLILHKLAFGKCARCDGYRKPKCQCPGGDPSEPEVRRIRWRNPRDRR